MLTAIRLVTLVVCLVFTVRTVTDGSLELPVKAYRLAGMLCLLLVVFMLTGLAPQLSERTLELAP
jgi:hypothetical protein